eukprot:COSAG02_NODE_14714_length_1243_cov_7.187937_1_plen_126_part_10
MSPWGLWGSRKVSLVGVVGVSKSVTVGVVGVKIQHQVGETHHELLEQSTPPGHTTTERKHPPDPIHKGSGHKKRKASAYNLFVGKWMRENTARAGGLEVESDSMSQPCPVEAPLVSEYDPWQQPKP